MCELCVYVNVHVIVEVPMCVCVLVYICDLFVFDFLMRFVVFCLLLSGSFCVLSLSIFSVRWCA